MVRITITLLRPWDSPSQATTALERLQKNKENWHGWEPKILPPVSSFYYITALGFVGICCVLFGLTHAADREGVCGSNSKAMASRGGKSVCTTVYICWFDIRCFPTLDVTWNENRSIIFLYDRSLFFSFFSKLMRFRMHYSIYPLCLSSFIIITGLLQWISLLVVVNLSISVGLAKLHLTPNFLMEFVRIFIILLHALCSSLEFPTKREKKWIKAFWQSCSRNRKQHMTSENFPSIYS